MDVRTHGYENRGCAVGLPWALPFSFGCTRVFWSDVRSLGCPGVNFWAAENAVLA